MDNCLKIFVCRDDFESVMTGVFCAWESALKLGHENVRLVKEPVDRYELFCEYVNVEADEKYVERVVNSVRRKISEKAYMMVYLMALSDDKDSPQVIYDFMRVGFRYGAESVNMYQIPAVQRANELTRSVNREIGLFKEFTRFSSVDNKVYVAHLSPRSNVVPEVSRYFLDRMPSEYWIIVDDTRRTACIHPKDEDFYVKNLDDYEFDTLRMAESRYDEYTSMWKTFFTAVSIKERENRRCQMNHFPKWMRAHATEFTI